MKGFLSSLSNLLKGDRSGTASDGDNPQAPSTGPETPPQQAPTPTQPPTNDIEDVTDRREGDPGELDSPAPGNQNAGKKGKQRRDGATDSKNHGNGGDRKNGKKGHQDAAENRRPHYRDGKNGKQRKQGVTEPEGDSGGDGAKDENGKPGDSDSENEGDAAGGKKGKNGKRNANEPHRKNWSGEKKWQQGKRGPNSEKKDADAVDADSTAPQQPQRQNGKKGKANKENTDAKPVTTDEIPEVYDRTEVQSFPLDRVGSVKRLVSTLHSLAAILAMSGRISPQGLDHATTQLASAANDVKRVNKLMNQSLFARDNSPYDFRSCSKTMNRDVLDYWFLSLDNFSKFLTLACDLIEPDWRSIVPVQDIAPVQDSSADTEDNNAQNPDALRDLLLDTNDLASILATPTSPLPVEETAPVVLPAARKQKVKYTRLTPNMLLKLENVIAPDSVEKSATVASNSTKKPKSERKSLADAAPIADKPTFGTEMKHRCDVLATVISSFASCTEQLQYCPPLAHKFLHKVFFSGNVAFNITPKDATKTMTAPFDVKMLPILTLLPEILASPFPRGVLQSSTGSGKTILTPIILLTMAYKDVYSYPTAVTLALTSPVVLLTLPSSTIVNEKITFYSTKHPDLDLITLRRGPAQSELKRRLTQTQYEPALAIATPSSALESLYHYDGSKLSRMRVILDEAHDRKAHLDVLLTRMCAMQGLSTPLSLLLMSATPDDDVSNKLGQAHTHNLQLQNQELYKVSVERVSIKNVNQVEDVVVTGGVKVLDEMVGDDHLKPRGHTLIFMSGLKECEKVARSLSFKLADRSHFPRDENSTVGREEEKENTAVDIDVSAIATPTAETDAAKSKRQKQPLYYVLRSTVPDKLQKEKDFYKMLSEEVAAAKKAKKITKDHNLVWIVVLTGRVSPIQQKIAQAPFPQELQGILKVIVATNAIESSVTIEGLTALVDSGMHKESRYDPYRGVSILEEKPISESSRTQRKGRVGRISCGNVVQVVMEAGNTVKVSHNMPEILSSDPGQTIMQMRKLSILLEEVNPDLPSPLPEATLRKTLEDLKNLGLVTDSGLTPKGYNVSRLDDLKPLYGVAIHDAYTRSAAEGYFTLLVITVLSAFGDGLNARDCGDSLLTAIVDPYSELATLTNVLLACFAGLRDDKASRQVGVAEKSYAAAKTMFTNGIRALHQTNHMPGESDPFVKVSEAAGSCCEYIGAAPKYYRREVEDIIVADKLDKRSGDIVRQVLVELRHAPAVRNKVTQVLKGLETYEQGWLTTKKYVLGQFEVQKNLAWYVPNDKLDALSKCRDWFQKEAMMVRFFQPSSLIGPEAPKHVYLLQKEINATYASMTICKMYHSADPVMEQSDSSYTLCLKANGQPPTEPLDYPRNAVRSYLLPQSLFHNPFAALLLDLLLPKSPVPLKFGKGEIQSRPYNISPLNSMDAEKTASVCLFTIASTLTDKEIAAILNTVRNIVVDFAEDFIVQSDDRVAFHYRNDDEKAVHMGIHSICFLKEEDLTVAQAQAQLEAAERGMGSPRIANPHLYCLNAATLQAHIRNKRQRAQGGAVSLRPVLIYSKESITLGNPDELSEEAILPLNNNTAKLPLEAHVRGQTRVFQPGPSCLVAYMSEELIPELAMHELQWFGEDVVEESPFGEEFKAAMEPYSGITCVTLDPRLQYVASYMVPCNCGFVSKQERNQTYPLYSKITDFIPTLIAETERLATLQNAGQAYKDKVVYSLNPQSQGKYQPDYSFRDPATLETAMVASGAKITGSSKAWGNIVQFYTTSETSSFPPMEAKLGPAIVHKAHISVKGVAYPEKVEPITVPFTRTIVPEVFPGITLRVANPWARARGRTNADTFDRSMKFIKDRMGCLLVEASPSGLGWKVTLPNMSVLPLFVKMLAADFKLSLVAKQVVEKPTDVPVIVPTVAIPLPAPNYRIKDGNKSENTHAIIAGSQDYQNWLTKLSTSIVTPTPIPSEHWKKRSLITITPVYMTYADMPIRITFPADEHTVFQQAAERMGVKVHEVESSASAEPSSSETSEQDAPKKALYAEINSMAELLEYYTRVPSMFGNVHPMVAKVSPDGQLDTKDLRDRAGIMRSAVSTVLNVVPSDVSSPIIFSNALMVCFVRHPAGHVQKLRELYKDAKGSRHLENALGERVMASCIAHNLPMVRVVMDINTEAVGMNLPAITRRPADDDEEAFPDIVDPPDTPELSDLIDERVVARFPSNEEIPASEVFVRFIAVQVTRREAGDRGIDGYLGAEDVRVEAQATAQGNQAATDGNRGARNARTVISPTWSFLQWYFTDQVSSNEDLMRKAGVNPINDEERWDREFIDFSVIKKGGKYSLMCPADIQHSAQVKNFCFSALAFAKAHSLHMQIHPVSSSVANYMRVVGNKNKKFKLTSHYFPDGAYIMFNSEFEKFVMQYVDRFKNHEEVDTIDLDKIADHADKAQTAWLAKMDNLSSYTYTPRLDESNLEACIMCCDGPTQLRDVKMPAWLRVMKGEQRFDDGERGQVDLVPADVTLCVTCFQMCLASEVPVVTANDNNQSRITVNTLALRNGNFQDMNVFSGFLSYDVQNVYHVFHNAGSAMHHIFSKIPDQGFEGEDSADPQYLTVAVMFKAWLNSLACTARPTLQKIFKVCPDHPSEAFCLREDQLRCTAVTATGVCDFRYCQRCKFSHKGPCESEILNAKREIVDAVTLSCPRCRAAYIDFDGCCAVKCANCQCGFCGLCLIDCGNDAHAHVLTCHLNPDKTNYFASGAIITAANNVVKKERVLKVMERVEQKWKQAVFNDMHSMISDLNITLQDIGC